MVMDYAAAYERTHGKPYAETFRCPGGELCLDFCNTGQDVRHSEDEEDEWLPDFRELVTWLQAAGAVSAKQAGALRAAEERSPEAAHRVWLRALRFREALARALLARAQGRAPFTDDVQLIEQEYARSARFARLTGDGDKFRWTVDSEPDELDFIMRPLVESAVSLMTSPRMARVRRCGNATCYWLFVDETKNASRRWCEMASCGNLMKVRRHRARARRTKG
jgi:predicted RNA-binding Zn ribbon-like protein